MLYLAQAMPEASPTYVEVDDIRWPLWPVETAAIAAELERWVVQEVRLNVERLRPHPGDPDYGIKWAIYSEDLEKCQKALRRGEYEALSTDFNDIVHFTDRGFAEALYQCIAYKHTEAEYIGTTPLPRDKVWEPPPFTREMAKRILDDPVGHEEMKRVWWMLNFPKVLAGPTMDGQTTNPQDPPRNSSPSAGENSSGEPSSATESSSGPRLASAG
jgi:hypothetical protein